jgi:hypothetical protein
MQVKPSKPLRPQRPPPELEQQFLVTQRARQQRPKSTLEQHLETLSAAQQIYARTQQLREQTRRLCGL